ncbi:Fpg/Nei family DNA glycosylase [Geminisphaera colitermitum]|uniref:Fpg/Nei family DNA glycosylase n=1 Tax=Geminisphaera colitermitum TaxID=1148786 RepID=UPI000158D057|nr:DNA-formamidopyrimidine glycosylase family protein [Geminisphaera colitermitum]
MPELAEVEFFRKLWNPGIGAAVVRVLTHPRARVFRECEGGADELARLLTGAVLDGSEARGKQMIFRFRTDGGGHKCDDVYVWLGIHLGMTGALRMQGPSEQFRQTASDHLALVQAERVLVFNDPRMFGRVRFATGAEPPDWWISLPPEVVSREFTVDGVAAFLKRRSRAPIKAVLLMQERFPGIGNWMADEILWRSAIHPRQLAGELTPAEIRKLWRETRWVCEQAQATIGETYADPPSTWLFPHRWEDGGKCPRTGAPLVREQIGGRTTCWSPKRQRLRMAKAAAHG